MRRIRRTRLTKRQDKSSDPLEQRIAPLLKGEVVKLVIEYSKKQGTTNRQVQRLLLLTPGSVYGMRKACIVVNVVDQGCCIVYPGTGKGLAPLTRAGVPIALAKVLLSKLDKLFGE